MSTRRTTSAIKRSREVIHARQVRLARRIAEACAEYAAYDVDAKAEIDIGCVAGMLRGVHRHAAHADALDAFRGAYRAELIRHIDLAHGKNYEELTADEDACLAECGMW